MMGQHSRSESLFYYFRIEDQVPENHLLRLIDRHIRLTRLCQRDCIAERSAPRQVQRSPDIIGKFSLNDPVVAIGDGLLLRPAPGITRLPWLPIHEVCEAARVFSSLAFHCFFHCSH